MAGLTPQGFVPATAQELRVIIGNALKANLGGDIDTNPSSRIGQFIDIVATELESLWYGLEAVYDSQFPNSASGVSLDNIGSLTNTPRNPGSGGLVQVYFGGQLGAPVPSGTVVAHVNGFELATKEARNIVANSWLAYTDLIPTSDKADFNMTYNGLVNNSFEIYDSDTSDVIKTKLVEASKPKIKLHTLGRGFGMAAATVMPGTTHPFQMGDVISIVDNDGGYFTGTHTIIVVPDNTEFAWDDTGTAINPREVYNSYATGQASLLSPAQVSVAGQFSISGGVWMKFSPTNPADIFGIVLVTNDMYSGATRTTMEVEQSVDQAVNASGTSNADQTFDPHTILQIVSSAPGLNSVINLASGTPASDRESDAEYRARLQGELTNSGACSIAGIYAAIKALPGVTWVAIVDNPLSTSDAQGRPAHSMELYVEGGDDNTIAQKLYDLHPAGVQIVSTAVGGQQRSGSVVDVNGQPKTVLFSSVQRVDVIVEVTGTKNTSYPSNGDDLVKDAIAGYINSLDIAEIFYSHQLYAPINTVPGISTLTVKAALKLQTPVINAVIDPGPLSHVYIDRSIPGNITITLT